MSTARQLLVLINGTTVGTLSAQDDIWRFAYAPEWIVNRPGFPRRLGASGSDAAQTRQAAGRQHWNDDVWGYRTFRCS